MKKVVGWRRPSRLELGASGRWFANGNAGPSPNLPSPLAYVLAARGSSLRSFYKGFRKLKLAPTFYRP
jgi:hypothetical protein